MNRWYFEDLMGYSSGGFQKETGNVNIDLAQEMRLKLKDLELLLIEFKRTLMGGREDRQE